MKSPPVVVGLSFPALDSAGARVRERLLRLTVEVTESSCNLHCRYCWSDSGGTRPHSTSVETLCSVVRQAAACGARTVVLTGGGEPTLDFARLRYVGEFCAKLDLWVVIFTNGTLVDSTAARFFKDGPFSVVAKLHSLTDAATADWLADQVGAHETMKAGLMSLLNVGLAEDGRLGCEAVIVRRNYGQIPVMWRWMRQVGIVPYFEAPKRLGRAKSLPDGEFLAPSEMGEVFFALAAIDREEFGFDWVPRPPIAGIGCDKWRYALYVAANGDVYPCSGVRLPLGNVNRVSLAEILASPFCQKMRDVYAHLAGRCAKCVWNSECYGCRADAFALTGDPFAEDPSCWQPAPSIDSRRR